MAITNQQLYDTWKASEEHLNDILSKLNATLAVKAADTDAELALIKTELESIKDQITAIKSTDGIKKIADAVKVTADDNTIAGLGALAAAAVTDPAASASVIALLKGILKQLQGTGTGAAPIQLTGSYVKQSNQSVKTSIASVRRIIGNGTDVYYTSSSSGNGFIPFDITNIKKYMIKIRNTSAVQIDSLGLLFSDNLAAGNVRSTHEKYFFDLDTPTLAAGATMYLNSEELPKMRAPFIGLGISYRAFDASGADLAAPIIFEIWGYK